MRASRPGERIIAALGWLLAFWLVAAAVWVSSLHDTLHWRAISVGMGVAAFGLLRWALTRTLVSVGDIVRVALVFAFFNLRVDALFQAFREQPEVVGANVLVAKVMHREIAHHRQRLAIFGLNRDE